MDKIVATKIKETDPGKALYELSRPVEYESFDADESMVMTTEYVIISAVNVPYSGPETFIFPSDKDGTTLSWGELSGSYKGGLDHETAIKNAGWVPHYFQ
jgi:hypothetical protein